MTLAGETLPAPWRFPSPAGRVLALAELDIRTRSRLACDCPAHVADGRMQERRQETVEERRSDVARRARIRYDGDDGDDDDDDCVDDVDGVDSVDGVDGVADVDAVRYNDIRASTEKTPPAALPRRLPWAFYRHDQTPLERKLLNIASGPSAVICSHLGPSVAAKSQVSTTPPPRL